MRLYILLLLSSILMACATTGNSSTSSMVEREARRNSVTSEDVPFPSDLTQYLIRVNGVNVVGTGGGAQVTVRGSISLQEGFQYPLYVINGNPIGNDYLTIFNAVAPEDIRQVRVLKDASDIALYGVRGAAGVIEITLLAE